MVRGVLIVVGVSLMLFGDMGDLVAGLPFPAQGPLLTPHGGPSSDSPVVRVGPIQPEVGFLKLGDIKGTAITKNFQGQIVFGSMQYAVQQAGEFDDGSRLSGRITTFSDLTLVKDMDTSSPFLATACAVKAQFPTAVIELTDGSGRGYFRVTLENVMVSSVSVGFHVGAAPTESVTLRYKKATWEWGKAKGGYDLRTGMKL